MVTLSSGNDGNIGLANIADDASGATAASLSISSEGGLSLGTISLNDTTNGALSLTVDSDNADAESETLSVTGISNVGALTLSGGYSSNSDDIIDIGADLTTTGSIVIQNADSVNIDASAARTITSGGAITITSNIEGILLDGGDNLVTLTNGTSDGDIALGAITDDASGASAADLTITSSGNVTLGTVSLNDVTDGDLIITVDSDDADGEAETLTLGGAITDVALITLNGGYSANSDDIIEINADLTTTGGAITIADADSVNIDASAARTITSGGAITITSNIEGILLDGGDNLVTLTNGTSDGDIGAWSDHRRCFRSKCRGLDDYLFWKCYPGNS